MSTDAPWTIGRLLDWTTQFLHNKGVESARLDAQLLLAHALGCTRMALYTRYTEEPSEAERVRYRELVQQRVKGSPVAYLLGRKEFFLLEFEVGPQVLVPRPDTETLVTEALMLLKPLIAPRVFDVGTGSGCIALSIAHEHKSAIVTAGDISREALEVARRNAAKHQLTERVRFVEGDLFAAVAGEKFDLIVSNPPYIRTGDLAELAPEVRQEPRLALDGGPTGLAVIDRLVYEAAGYLEPGGHLMLEIGHDQDAEVRQRLALHDWEFVKTVQDRSGHARVVVARCR